MSTGGVDDAIASAEAELALFPDWEERFSYIIDLGRSAPPLESSEKIEANKVRGCASQVWLVTEDLPGGRLGFRAESDAHLVRGLIALLLGIFSGRTPQDILSVEPRALAERLGLSGALTAQRSNGLYAMMERIRRDAAARV
jgi:cysteine desulfuration protein SufE